MGAQIDKLGIYLFQPLVQLPKLLHLHFLLLFKDQEYDTI